MFMEVKNWFLTVKIRPCMLANVFSCVPAKGNLALQKGLILCPCKRELGLAKGLLKKKHGWEMVLVKMKVK